MAVLAQGSKENPKVVVLHDWVTGFRGGERVLEAILELFPKAPLYTMIFVPGSSSPLIENRPVYSSWLSRLPGISKHYRKLLPLFPWAVSSLKIQEPVDLVISSSHCLIKGVAKPRGSRHLSYIHSPMRYMYDQYDVYFGPTAPFLYRWGARLFKNFLVNFDLKSNRNVDLMLANSAFVQERIRKFYQMPSRVLHPFVDLKDFASLQASPPAKKDFDVMVTAFAPNKRVDLAIQAYNRLGRKLVIIGSGQEEERLRALAGPSIEFQGNLSREQVLKNLFEARALIFPGVEDFGIVPLEALAAGTPVIAYRAGGVLETLNDETAVFFDEVSVDSLIRAVQAFDSRSFEREKLWARAREFSKESFQTGLKKAIHDLGFQI